MHHADIHAALIKAGHPPGKCARELGVTPTAVSNVLRGKSNSRRIAEHIAKKTGISVSKLFPGRYANRAFSVTRTVA